LVAQKNQHGGRRKYLCQGRGCGNSAGGKPRVIAKAHHRRQHDQTRRHRRGADNAFGGSKQRSDDDRGDCESAAQRAEETSHRLQQIFGDP